MGGDPLNDRGVVTLFDALAALVLIAIAGVILFESTLGNGTSSVDETFDDISRAETLARVALLVTLKEVSYEEDGIHVLRGESIASLIEIDARLACAEDGCTQGLRMSIGDALRQLTSPGHAVRMDVAPEHGSEYAVPGGSLPDERSGYVVEIPSARIVFHVWEA